jgi:hypothetical protein
MSMHYQPELDAEDTAIKALFLLYRRGHWSLLEDTGLTRKDHQEALDRANDEFGMVLSKADVALLKLSCPFLKEAANNLRLVYTLKTIPKGKTA